MRLGGSVMRLCALGPKSWQLVLPPLNYRGAEILINPASQEWHRVCAHFAEGIPRTHIEPPVVTVGKVLKPLLHCFALIGVATRPGQPRYKHDHRNYRQRDNRFPPA